MVQREAYARAWVERDTSAGPFELSVGVEHRGEDLEKLIPEIRNLAIFAMLDIENMSDPHEGCVLCAEAAIKELYPDRAYFIETTKLYMRGVAGGTQVYQPFGMPRVAPGEEK